MKKPKPLHWVWSIPALTSSCSLAAHFHWISGIPIPTPFWHLGFAPGSLFQLDQSSLPCPPWGPSQVSIPLVAFLCSNFSFPACSCFSSPGIRSAPCRSRSPWCPLHPFMLTSPEGSAASPSLDVQRILGVAPGFPSRAGAATPGHTLLG